MPDTPQRRNDTSSERKKVGMLLPPPVLLVVTLFLGVVTHRAFVGEFAFTPLGLALGGVLITLALLGIGACILRFHRAGTPFRPVSPATTIVRAGMYRMSRNPMYVCMAGILLGASLLLGSHVLALAVVPFVLIVHFGVVLPEERYLEQLHGESYREYKRMVRRWL